MALTKEQKKSKILDYLDKKAKLKEFKVDTFTIGDISEYLDLDGDEVKELMEELIQEKSVYKDKIIYDIYLPKGDYENLDAELSSKKYIPFGMEQITRLFVSTIIIWIILVTLTNYKNILTDLISETPLSLLVCIILLVVVIYLIGHIINEIFIRILMRYENARDIAVKIKPLVLTGIIIWIIMLVPFGCMYYFFDEQNKIFAMFYLFVTIPTTILAAVGIQDYLMRKKINSEKKN